MLKEREICEKNNIEFIYFRRQKINSDPRRNINNMKVIGNRTNGENKIIRLYINFLRSFDLLDKLYKTAYRFKKELDQQKLTFQNAYDLIKHEKPDIIIVMNDIRIDLEIFLLKVAKRLNIPTIQIGWSWTHPIRRNAQFQLHRENHGIVQRKPEWLIMFCKYFIPDIYTEFNNKRVLFNDPLIILVSKFFRVKSASPYNKGRNVDVVTATSNAQRKVYLSLGINGSRIKLTGDPSNDRLISLKMTKNNIKNGLLSELGFDKSELLVTIASAPFGFISSEQNKTTVEIIMMLLTLSPNLKVIFKPHPQENNIDFGYINKISKSVTIANNYAVEDLTAASQLFLTVASSSMISAVALDIPVILYDFTQINYIDRYQYTRSVKRVFNLESLKIAVKDILFNVDERKKTIEMQRNRIKPFAILDGKCIQRNASVIINTLPQ